MDDKQEMADCLGFDDLIVYKRDVRFTVRYAAPIWSKEASPESIPVEFVTVEGTD
jgi:hypothetical protein